MYDVTRLRSATIPVVAIKEKMKCCVAAFSVSTANNKRVTRTGPSDRFEAPLVFDVHTPRACEVAAHWTAGVGAGE